MNDVKTIVYRLDDLLKMPCNKVTYTHYIFEQLKIYFMGTLGGMFSLPLPRCIFKPKNAMQLKIQAPRKFTIRDHTEGGHCHAYIQIRHKC